MHLLFLLKFYKVGGQETVTNILARKFVDEGHFVSVVCFTTLSPIMLKRADARINFHELNGFNASKKNVVQLRQILIDENIHVIIDQWGLPFISTWVAKQAIKRLQVKYVSVYHNDPGTNGRLKGIEEQLTCEQSPIKRGVLKIKRLFFRIVTGISMNYVYEKSDAYVLLSESYAEAFRKFAFLGNVSKVKIIANPLTIDIEKDDNIIKRKEIIFVGRLDNNQKRVDRILEIWAEIHEKHNDWKLTIVGDGSDRETLERQMQMLQLRNIEFAGYKDPAEYYKRASILLLVSEYEGFPLVLVEGMSMGAVPVVYGSFSAVFDIVENGVNGIIVPPEEGEYSRKSMIDALCSVLEDERKREFMSNNAVSVSVKFDIEKICEKWVLLFNGL